MADLGAGSGLFVVPLSNAVGANGNVLAVEIDRNYFAHLQGKAKASGVTNVQTIAGEPIDPKLKKQDLSAREKFPVRTPESASGHMLDGL